MKAVPTHRPAHAATGRRDSNRAYDRTRRDREAKAFYHSRRWLKLSAIKLRQDPCCERCLLARRIVRATVAHHRIERREDPSLELDIDNLESLCASCHARHHKTDASRP